MFYFKTLLLVLALALTACSNPTAPTIESDIPESDIGFVKDPVIINNPDDYNWNFECFEVDYDNIGIMCIRV